nr:replication protein A 70 kDa DNA-binding subunit-like [Aedes albopictus]
MLPAVSPNVAAHQNQSMGGLNSRVSSGGDRMSLKTTSPYPISSLSPYQNKWVVRARVMSKWSVRTWSNAKGEGRLFWMDVMDESGGIRVTAFNEQCDRYYDMIEVDKVYYISKCNVKQANKHYSSFKNDYEVTMTNDTIIQECKDAGSFKPSMQYSFVPISQIGTMEANAIIDVIGVCKEAGDVIQFTARSTGRELKKREVILVDKSNVAVPLILWGVDAQNFNASSNPVLVIKGVRVYEFGGSKKLGLIASSVMNIDPDIEEAHRMRGWYLSGGCDIVVDSVSTRTAIGAGFSAEWLTFHDAKEMKLGTGDKADFFHVRAVVRNIKSANAVYKACPQPNCNKKVIDQGNGQYRCEKCNASFPDFKYRLLVNMLVCDWTSNRWVTVFTDLAEQMLGTSSQDIGNALESNAREAERIFSAIHFKSYVFKLRTKVDNYAGAPRSKTIAVAAVDKLNHKEYNAYLIQNIQKLTGVGKQ